MIAILKSRFRSATQPLRRQGNYPNWTQPTNAKQYRGTWVLVMRYRDDDGHILFKFVGPADRVSKKHNIEEYVSATESHAARSSRARAHDRDSTRA